MMELLREMLSYPFIVRALTGGLLISLCASLLGVSLVLKRYSMIGDGLIPRILWSPVHRRGFWVVSPGGIHSRGGRRRGASPSDHRQREDQQRRGHCHDLRRLPGGGDHVTSLTTGMTTDVSSYMFGSILAMSREDVILAAGLSVIVL